MMQTKAQLGTTLIIVLLLLLLITVIGTLTVKESLSALRIAMSSQVQQLLAQHSDAVIFHFEDPSQLSQYLVEDGILHLIFKEENLGKEFVFCDLGAAHNLYQKLGEAAYCTLDKNKANQGYGRNLIMTQVAIKAKLNHNNMTQMQSSKLDQQGDEEHSIAVDPIKNVLLIVTSVIPSMNIAAENKINDCFSKHLNQAVQSLNSIPRNNMGESVAQCLNQLGMAVHTQIVEYQFIDSAQAKLIAQRWYEQ